MKLKKPNALVLLKLVDCMVLGLHPKNIMYLQFVLIEKKLIFNDTPKTWEYYDLDADPNEEKNLYDEENEEIKSLKSKLTTHLEANHIQTNIS